MTFSKILTWCRRAFHAVSRPTTGTPTVQRAPDTSGVGVNSVLLHTATLECFRVGSFNLEKSQWKTMSGKGGYLRGSPED